MFRFKKSYLGVSTKERYGQVFLIALITATVFFLPFLIMDNGLFLFYGDYNVQQIPFYKLAHEAIRTGNIFWNQYTDLGANFIGSYSFYLLGSPFFWLTIPFPNDWVPYLMGPLLILKFSCSSVTSYAFIRRFTKTSETALLGGLLYAFCGFNVYNIFFNHFQEAVVFFPLMLIALEEFVINNRRGVFALSVCLCAVVNYFFFAGEVVFLFLYFFIRCTDKRFEINLKKFSLLAFESVIGVLCAMFLLLPSLLAITGNGRLEDMLSGWDLLFYGDEQRYGLILQSFFLPPDIPARPNFFPDSNAKWASVAAYLPMISFAGVIAFLKSKKKHWASKIIKICILFAFIPGLNALFTMFNYNYYARWFYMPLLLMAMMTSLALEDHKIDLIGGIKWTTLIICGLAVIGIVPSSLKWDESITPAPWYEILAVWGGILFVLTSIVVLFCTVFRFEKRDEKVKESLPAYLLSTCVLAIVGMLPIAWYGQQHDNFSAVGNFLPPFVERFWGYVVIGVVGLAITVFVLSLRKKRRLFLKLATVGICLITVAYSVVFIAFGKSHAYSYYDVVAQGIEGGQHLNLPKKEGEFYRIDVYDGMDNYPMFWKTPTIQAFHSIVPSSIMEFYSQIGVQRGVGSRPELKYYGLRGLTSVKYLLTDNTSDTPFIPGFEKMDHQNGFDIYENTYYIPMGFTYDKYITEDTFEMESNDDRDRLLLEGILLTEEQVDKYGSYYTELVFEDVPYFDNDNLKGACEARQKETCSSFITDQRGFTANITPSRDTLAFFSVPYDEGWSATVNGKKVEVEKVNVGFMAVPVEAGKENVIRFEYTTPGLYLGILISLIAFLLLLAYYLLFRLMRKKNPQKYGVQKYAHLRYTNSLDSIKAGRSYSLNVIENCRILSAISNSEVEEAALEQEKSTPLEPLEQISEPTDPPDENQ